MILPTITRNSPTFSANLFDDDLQPTVQPVVDSIAVISDDSSKLYAYVVNRSLTDDVDFQLLLGDLPGSIESAVAETLTADSYDAINSAAEPQAIKLQNSVLTMNADDIRLSLGAHSLTRITLSFATELMAS